jgi:hypothetical protein
MPILLAGEDAASDCFAGVGADVGLLAGGDWARRGVAKHNVVTTRRGLTIECLLALRFWTRRGRASGPIYRNVDDDKVDDAVRPYHCLLVKIPVKSAVSRKAGNAATFARNDAEKLGGLEPPTRGSRQILSGVDS